MTKADLDSIEQKLKIKLPKFYTGTMIDYPFHNDSHAAEFTLCNDVDSILDCCSVFPPEDGKFAVGHDGGEYIYYIKLNGEDKVYIFDMEGSEVHNSVLADSWAHFLEYIDEEAEEIRQDESLMEEKRRKKNWWQFWI